MDNEAAAQHDFLVVIGASAGGLESLSAIVETLPSDFAAPIVIGMHISPNRVSHLGSILSKRTALPVVILEDRVKLIPGTIYVVPSNRNVQILDGHALLTSDNPGPQPSVDLLFGSAAEAHGENLIAVVLSGTGSDGSIGARVVKSHGGTVIVQNPDTAAFPGMPLSLSLSDVDLTADLDRIPGLLTNLVHGGLEVPVATEHPTLRSFLEELREESGVDFAAYRQATIQRRVQRRMAATGVTTFPEYLRAVRRNPEERRYLVKSFLINVTQFFRDDDLFDYLREHVLPELISEAASRNGELRIWSAGCSTGEEAYSLAMVLHELIEQSGSPVRVRIFATDLDKDAVAFARQGIFPARALGNVPRDFIDRYFEPLGDEYGIRKHIRSMIVFGDHDLARRAPFPRIDLILCRNVLIYFTLPLQRRALELFAFSLRNGGYLVLGKSETVTPFGELFASDQTALKVYRRVGTRTQILQPLFHDVMPSHSPGKSALMDSQIASRKRARAATVRATALGLSVDEEGILHGLPIGVVVVSAAYDVQHINPEARRLLGIHTTAVGQDLIHLVKRFDPLAIRGIIDDASCSDEPSGRILALDDATGNEPQRVEVTCRSMNQGEDTHMVLTVIDVTEREQIRGRLAGADEASSRLIQANEEVLTTNNQLSRTIQALREENEQIQVTTAEVQEATEEMETLNEELETLNEELQATIEELNTTYDDLEARSLELQAVALEAENARLQLRVILDAVDDGVIVVESNGIVLLHSQMMSSSLGEALETAGFLHADGTPMAPDETPIARAAAGETFSMMFTIAGSPRRLYEAVGRPVEIQDGRRLGVVTVRPSVKSDVPKDR